MWSGENEKALKRVHDFCRTYGVAKLGVQLADAGRKGPTTPPGAGDKPIVTDEEGGWTPEAPSATPYDSGLAGAACHDQGRHQACGQRQAALSVAQADVIQAEADVHQIRVSLGLLAQPESGDLGEVPPDLNRTFSSVREAQAALIQTAAQLGVTHSYEQLPKEMLKQFESLDQGDVARPNP
jgi:hypothetical protein